MSSVASPHVAANADSDELTFLKAIGENRSEGIRRLAFADWLEEHGRHIDAAIQRVLGDPDSNDFRRRFATACKDEADRIDAKNAFLILPESKMGQWLHFLRGLSQIVDTQLDLDEWGVTPRAYGNWHVDCRNRQDNPGSWNCCTSPPVDEKKVLCEWHQLKNKEVILFKGSTNRNIWFELPKGWESQIDNGWPRTDNCGFVRRGFVERVQCDASSWMVKAEWLMDRYPIRKVRFTTAPEIVWVGSSVRKLSDREKTLDVKSEVKASIGEIMLPLLLKNEWPTIQFEDENGRPLSYV